MADQLGEILRKAKREEALEREEISFLLNAEEADQLQLLFQSARDMRRRYFGEKVFLYGFLYLSTYCRNDCRFCLYRRSNASAPRYRQNLTGILAAARRFVRSGVHLIDLTMGEDPDMVGGGSGKFGRLLQVISEVKRAVGLPVMISPGVIPEAAIGQLRAAGASWYACYQETFNKRLFARLRPEQSYSERLQAKRAALEEGLMIEEGLLCGVGETCSELVEAIIAMGRMGASQMRAMTFVPQPGTPMAGRAGSEARRELQLLAVLRLVYPRVLIPASLDVAGLAGLKPRLDAGANVVTSIVPPGLGLAGVAHPTMDIANARRTTASIRAVLASNQLQAATSSDYRAWLETELKRVRPEDKQQRAQCALP